MPGDDQWTIISQQKPNLCSKGRIYAVASLSKLLNLVLVGIDLAGAVGFASSIRVLPLNISGLLPACPGGLPSGPGNRSPGSFPSSHLTPLHQFASCHVSALAKQEPEFDHEARDPSAAHHPEETLSKSADERPPLNEVPAKRRLGTSPSRKPKRESSPESSDDRKSPRRVGRKRTVKLVPKLVPATPDSAVLAASSGESVCETGGQEPVDINAVYKLEFDGASKGNPGLAGAGALLCDPQGNELCYVLQRMNHATSNYAEYMGLILGLKEAKRRGIRQLSVQGDSELVVKQLKKEYRVTSPNLAELSREAADLMNSFERCELSHVMRAENARADQLSNEAVALAHEYPLVCLPYLPHI